MADPSNLNGGLQASPFANLSSSDPFSLRDDIDTASPSKTNYSRSTAISPLPFNLQGDANSITSHPLPDHPPPDGMILKASSRRNQPRRRQMGVPRRRKQAAMERQAKAPPSKALIRRAGLIAAHGAHMIGADDDLKGEIRPRIDGFFEWKEPDTGKWLAAAPHDWFRADFIDISCKDKPYLEPPDGGFHPHDITSNCSILGQNMWRFDREGWKEIIDGEGNKVMFLKKAPARFEEFPYSNYLHHKGLVMLDPDDRPVLDWACIPLVISSKLEGSRMEALKRVFPWLKNADFRARMPRNTQDSIGRLEPLPKYSTFGQRMSRFRDRWGCFPWTERARTMERMKQNLHYLSADDEDHENNPMDTASERSLRHGSDSKMKEDDPTADGDNRPGKTSEVKQITASPTTSEPRVKTYSRAVNQSTSLLADQPTSIASSTRSYHDSVCPQPEVSFMNTTEPYYGTTAETASAMQSNLPDLRFLKPCTVSDEVNITNALKVTRADFRSRHGFEALLVGRGESYYTQYHKLQTQHEQLWIIDDEPPVLIGIDTWFGSFDTWPTPYLSRVELDRLLSVSGMPKLNQTNE